MKTVHASQASAGRLRAARVRPLRERERERDREEGLAEAASRQQRPLSMTRALVTLVAPQKCTTRLAPVPSTQTE